MTEPIAAYFPFESIREKQKIALDFIDRACAKGYRDIIIAAPTGTGKTGIGSSVCHWAVNNMSQSDAGKAIIPGGYYLTSQKMLQDQIERDFPKMKHGTSASLKSAMAYHCLSYDRPCGGLNKKNPCMHASCPYKIAKAVWQASSLAVTNYAYFFTSGQYTQDIAHRQVLVCDECHNLEREVIRYVDIKINEELFDRWTPGIKQVPKLNSLAEFVTWLKTVYIPEATVKYDALIHVGDDALADEAAELKQHVDKVQHGVDLVSANPNDWIFWRENGKQGKCSYIARPVEAKPFTHDLLFSKADLRVYMSAYPGNKSVFCRSLGLDEDNVAMASLSSTFPVKHRPIIFYGCGSMSLRNVDQSIPMLSLVVRRLLAVHKHEKGLIHCHSYKMMQIVRNAVKGSDDEARLICHDSAAERDTAYKTHVHSPDPTVLISPSISEGFDFADDAARWQLIVKCPYPHLGDKQVAVKKQRDEEWYAQQAVSSIIQACGRIVRSDQDWGITYILDSDFNRLYSEYTELFPGWWKVALIDRTKSK